MRKLIFYGTVIPERVNFSVSEIEKIIGAKDVKFKATIRLIITNSKIKAGLETESNYSNTDLKNTVQTFVQTILDSYGYLKGYAYDSDIDSMEDTDTGLKEIFGVDVVKITKDKKNRPVDLNSLVNLALGNVNLYTCLADLRRAIKYPLDTKFYCARAIDSIKAYFQKGRNKSKACIL